MEDSLLRYFSMMEDQGVAVVHENSRMELDSYIQNYRGRTRFARLFHIGRSSVYLCIEALKAAVAEAKKGRDISRYRDAVEHLRIVAPNEPEAEFDRHWLETTEKTNKAEKQRLEQELKAYKNNLIKESIRFGNEELGKFLESIGELDAAVDAYTRMRPDVSTSKHIVDVGKHIVSVSLQRGEWSMVIGNLAKMAGNQPLEDEKLLQPYCKIGSGIACMAQEKYADAAACFLDADPEPSAATYSELATPNDVAVYGGLLSLAVMNRQQLQIRVLEKSSFRTFLELEPNVRRAISHFVNGRYSACLDIVNASRPTFLLDINLGKHVPKLFELIRTKCIVSYLAAFSNVTLECMKANLAPQGESIEEELARLIKEGAVDARINTIDKVVTVISNNVRAKMQTKALKAAQNYEKEVIDLIRRMSIAAAELEVKGMKKATPLPMSVESMVNDPMML